MKTNPLVSVVTIVYNGKDFIEKTINNVIGQTYENIEYIIIDGGSTDGTLDIIKKHEENIAYYVSERDKGIYDAMNKGVQKATGEWVIIMTGGDEFYSKETVTDVFYKKTDSKIIFGKSISYFNDLQVLRYEDFELKKSSQWFLKKMPNHQAVFIHKDIYKDNNYSLNLKFFSDTDFLRKAFLNYPYEYRNVIISKFEIGGISNYYGSFKKYILVLKDSILLNNVFFRPFIVHTYKYILQVILGKEAYLKFYIKYLLKK